MFRKTILLGAALATLALAGCDRAISNMETLISDDCGQSWKEIPPGGAVPARVGVCALKVTIPSYPMAGEARFRTSFANRVMADTTIGYEYTIVDGKKFLTEARYLGRQNSDGDGADNSASKYESAENTIIDRRIREAVTTALINQDIVDFDQGKSEDALLAAINESLAERGVELASMQLVVTPDNQTRQAMDVVSARRVYASASIPELGDQIIVARSGASQISVNNSSATTPAAQ
jgi:hypothetical protein